MVLIQVRVEDKERVFEILSKFSIIENSKEVLKKLKDSGIEHTIIKSKINFYNWYGR